MQAAFRPTCAAAAAFVATVWSPLGAAAADSTWAVDSCSAPAVVAVTDRERAIVARAPEGYRITAYCVTVRGLGSEMHQLAAPSAAVEMAHSSGKAIEEYAVAYEESEVGESPDPDPSSGEPVEDAAEDAEHNDGTEATDGTNREVGSGVADSMMDIDALLGNKANAEERAQRSASDAPVGAERAPSAAGTFAAVSALALTGLAGAAIVTYLLRRRNRSRAAQHLDAPTRRATAVPVAEPATQPPSSDVVDAGPPAGPAPRHAAPTFVVGDDAQDFPSIR